MLLSYDPRHCSLLAAVPHVVEPATLDYLISHLLHLCGGPSELRPASLTLMAESEHVRHLVALAEDTPSFDRGNFISFRYRDCAILLLPTVRVSNFDPMRFSAEADPAQQCASPEVHAQWSPPDDLPPRNQECGHCGPC